MRKKEFYNQLSLNGIKIPTSETTNKISQNEITKKLLDYDYVNIINITKYIQGTRVAGNRNVISPNKVTEYIEADSWLKIACWFMIKKIEEKLTAAMQWKLGFGIEDYATDDFFETNKKIIITVNIDLYNEEKTNFINWIKSEKKKIAESLFYKDGNLPFEIFVSNIAFDKKIKFLTYLDPNITKEILIRVFGTKLEKRTLNLINMLNKKIAQNNTITDATFLFDNKEISLTELLSVITLFCDDSTNGTFNLLLDTAPENVKYILTKYKAKTF